MPLPTRIRRDVRVFISAVTKELGSVRGLVDSALKANDYHAVQQDDFPLSYKGIREKLRERISSCDALIHVAGRCYGAEPNDHSPDTERRSYTQFEFDLATELQIPVYVFLTRDCFPADPHAPEPDDLRQLQDQHRLRLSKRKEERRWISTREELDREVRSLQLKVELLEEELTRVDQKVAQVNENVSTSNRNLLRWTVIGVFVALFILNVVLFERNEQRNQRDQQEQERVAQRQERDRQDRERTKQEEERRAAQEARQQAQKIDPELFRQEIREKAEQLIRELPNENGRWQKVAEIERQRDLQLTRVDELVGYIRATLESGASDVFQRALEIQGDTTHGGIEAAIEYLESKRAHALATAKQQAHELSVAKAELAARENELRKTLQAVALQAELLEASMQWDAALLRREEVVAVAPDWFEARNSLGMLQLTMAHYREAEAHLRIALRHAGNEDDEANGLCNLAQLLQATDRLAQAEPLMRRSLGFCNQSYGDEHPAVATGLNNLALLLIDTNRSSQAEPLLRRAIAVDEQYYGTEHPQVASNLINLAGLLRTDLRLVEAEALYHRGIQIDEQFYGIN
ncbi:MAG: tetratricopeptide repeat protein, partial [Planctomycetaceae bacterium]|nr:tetratricopeptide repeat protein [Planctomycetaceae bacterium]